LKKLWVKLFFIFPFCIYSLMGVVLCCGGGTESSYQRPDVLALAVLNSKKESTSAAGSEINTAESSALDGDDITVLFEACKIGLKLTSDVNGNDAYVTDIDVEKNPRFKEQSLELYSKILKINDEPVESKSLYEISKLIEAACSLPFTVTFCKPRGLSINEKPDLSKVV